MRRAGRIRDGNTSQPSIRLSGQGFVEYALLVCLLALVAVCVWIITGPGIDGLYAQLATAAREAEAELEVGRPPYGISLCTRLIMEDEGRVEIHATTPSAMSFSLGGLTECADIVETSAGVRDTILFDPYRWPPRLTCGHIDTLGIIVPSAREERGRILIPMEPASWTLRLRDGVSGPELVSANVEAGEVEIHADRLYIKGRITSFEVFDTRRSSTLEAFQKIGEGSLRLVFTPRAPASEWLRRNVTQGRWELAPVAGRARLEITAGCRQ